jgi:hypothetical protein
MNKHNFKAIIKRTFIIALIFIAGAITVSCAPKPTANNVTDNSSSTATSIGKGNSTNSLSNTDNDVAVSKASSKPNISSTNEASQNVSKSINPDVINLNTIPILPTKIDKIVYTNYNDRSNPKKYETTKNEEITLFSNLIHYEVWEKADGDPWSIKKSPALPDYSTEIINTDGEITINYCGQLGKYGYVALFYNTQNYSDYKQLIQKGQAKLFQIPLEEYNNILTHINSLIQ